MEGKGGHSCSPGAFRHRSARLPLRSGIWRRAKDFYRNMLGMRFLFDAGNMAFFQCGDYSLHDRHVRSAWSPRGNHSVLQGRGHSGDSCALTEQGVEFEQAPHLVAKMPGHDLWMAFLKDPDGNILGMMSEIARA